MFSHQMLTKKLLNYQPVFSHASWDLANDSIVWRNRLLGGPLDIIKCKKFKQKFNRIKSTIRHF